jgi:hypothetical protein
VKKAIDEEFQSMLTPMALYALGDHTMLDVVERYCHPENELFDAMQQNIQAI